MEIRTATAADLPNWVALRKALWPASDLEQLSEEARSSLDAEGEVCLLAVDEEAGIVGFIEGAVHQSPKGPYGHVEGWFVSPEYRAKGFGRELLSQYENWCLHRAICMVTSDTDAGYPTSSAAHHGCGFKTIATIQVFAKDISKQ